MKDEELTYLAILRQYPKCTLHWQVIAASLDIYRCKYTDMNMRRQHNKVMEWQRTKVTKYQQYEGTATEQAKKCSRRSESGQGKAG